MNVDQHLGGRGNSNFDSDDEEQEKVVDEEAQAIM